MTPQPHKWCLADPTLTWILFTFDLLIMVAYYLIPIGLMMLYAGRPRTGRWAYSIRSSMLVFFAAFIFACGTSHMLDAITVFVPWYWTDAVVKGITAGVSLATVGFMAWRRKSLVTFPSKIEEEHLELEGLRRRIAVLIQNG